MDPLKVSREQQVAVFDESGSGKTVLLSSFYGTAQEPSSDRESLFDVIADDSGQGRRLHQNYLGIKNSATVPLSTRFSGTSYALSIKRRPSGAGKTKKGRVEDLRLVWHDYPGEWFEEEPATDDEQQRRVDTFRSLLGSDVALLLVDGQRLVEHAGEEERYLKALVTNYRAHLARLRGDLMPDGKPLVQFPRIWLFALSKADLLPEVNVVAFRDLLVEKVGAEITLLEGELGSFIEAPQALSLGEDFVLLSSAKFEPGKIQVSKRIGVHLILPIASMPPFSRHIVWAAALHKGDKVASQLMSKSGPVLALLAAKVKLPGPLGIVAGLVLPGLANDVSKLTSGKLQQLHDDAKAKHDFLTAVLTGFQLDLDRGVDQKVLLKSLR